MHAIGILRPCGTKTRNCTGASRTRCLGWPYCTGASLSNALPRATRIRALFRLTVTPGGRALVFRIQYNSVLHRARLRGANRYEQERLTTHAIVAVMTLMLGGIARGKSLPGNLCVCLDDRVIYRAAVPACKYKPYPAGKQKLTRLYLTYRPRTNEWSRVKRLQYIL